MKAQNWDWILTATKNSDTGFLNMHPNSAIKLLRTDAEGNSYLQLNFHDTTSLICSNNNSYSSLVKDTSVGLKPFCMFAKIDRKGRLIWSTPLVNVKMYQFDIFDGELYVLAEFRTFPTYEFGQSKVQTSYYDWGILRFDQFGNPHSVIVAANTNKADFPYFSFSVTKNSLIFTGFTRYNDSYSKNRASVQLKGYTIDLFESQQFVFGIDKNTGQYLWHHGYSECSEFFRYQTENIYICDRLNNSVYVALNFTKRKPTENFQFPTLTKFSENGIELISKKLTGTDLKINYFRRVKAIGNNTIVVSGYINSKSLNFDNHIISKNYDNSRVENFVLVLDSSLNYKWHHVFKQTDYIRPEFTMDSSGNFYIEFSPSTSKNASPFILPNDKVFSLAQTEDESNTNNAIILVFDKKGIYNEYLSFPKMSYCRIFDMTSDNHGNIYIGLETGANFYNETKIYNIGDLSLSSLQSTANIVAKFNANELQINVDTLWCMDDSLSFTWNTKAFKSHTWQYENQKSTKTKFRPSVTATGTYKVSIIGKTYEDVDIKHSAEIPYYAPPTIKFAHPKYGCLFSPFTLTDQSLFDNYPNIPISIAVNFGDGFDTIYSLLLEDLKTFKPKHTYIQPGKYTVNYTVLHKGCSNSFTSQVEILPAPRPGITCSTTQGCSPLPVEFKRTFSDPIDSLIWNVTTEKTPFVNQPNEYTFSKGGNYWISQTIYGPSGCVTKDIQLIQVTQGIEPGKTPYLINATLLNNSSAQIIWEFVPHATSYTILLDGKFLASTKYIQWEYSSPSEITKPLSFTVIAVDSCGKSTLESNVARTLFCKVQEIDNGKSQQNQSTLVSFTPYIEWKEGIKNYTILTKFSNETEWQNMNSLNDTFHRDEEFIKESEIRKCYKIVAFSNENNVSESNELCLDYSPIIYIPSALTPNGDGLNDNFKFYVHGIENTVTRIYNRWGQKIWEGQGTEVWNPEPTDQPGAYAYTITGKSTKEAKELTFTGTITIVK
jgi:PKD repeat protein